jgi:hypothetical protein
VDSQPLRAGQRPEIGVPLLPERLCGTKTIGGFDP